MDFLPYLLLAVVAFMLWQQWRVRALARRAEGRPAPPYADLLEPEDDPGPPLLFYFYAERCGPCRAMAPAVDRLASEGARVVKVDVVHQPEAARRFNVMGTPTVVLVANGQVRRVLMGSVSEARLRGLLE